MSNIDFRQFAGFQELKEDSPNIVYYLSKSDDTEAPLTLCVLKGEVELGFTEQEALQALKSLIATFPVVHLTTYLEFEQARIDVARISCRGVPNVNYQNSWFYKGSVDFDAPFIVASRAGRFGIFVHPKYKEYGFTVNAKG